MVTAILDTNVFIRAAIQPGSPSARVLDAYSNGSFQLILSQAILEELLTVLLLPGIRRSHGLSDDEILQLVTDLPARAVFFPGEASVLASLPRDLTDVKFLSVAYESHADYLVTKDARHLLRLKKYRQTRILTPSKFLDLLP